ncbi:MAG: hypothetical protein J5820_01760 [Rhodocyclaceae bacterium]|nr:hypothetical protein [Rhodocyclaceae bacterium]
MAKEITLTQLETAVTRTKAYVDSKVSSVYRYKGSVAAYDDLPAGAEAGDVYNVEDTGANFAWTGTEWDQLGGSTVDLSAYLTSTQINTLLDAKQGTLTAGDGITLDASGNIAADFATDAEVTTMLTGIFG